MAHFNNQIYGYALLASLCIALAPLPVLSAEHAPEEELLIIEEEGPVIEGAEPAAPGEELLIIEEEPGRDEILIEPEIPETLARVGETDTDSGGLSVKLDELWAEYARFNRSASRADGQAYLHGQATALWNPSPRWDLQASLRLDGYLQHGRQDWEHATLDYDETFIRYRADNARVTLGAQKIAWGRIDEFPPTDRVSTLDLSRYILDDLAERKRASPAIRYEHFFGDRKLDLVFLPDFREAELPGVDSVWFPVNRQSGQILGIKSTPASEALVRSAPVDVKAAHSDGGFGIRYSATGEGVDYALTLQKVRQSIPYFNYNSTRGVLEAKYPRSWLLGGDLGVEALGAIWRLEAGWQSDAPVTRTDGAFDTVKSLSWGAGVEFFPGDGDARVNLQLTGINHIDAPAVINRTEIYLFGGSFEMPFAREQWRLKGRFYKGLDTHDLYLNPELAFTGWESQELYLEAHYFDGAAGTPGAFHQDNSLLAVGWRAKF